MSTPHVPDPVTPPVIPTLDPATKAEDLVLYNAINERLKLEYEQKFVVWKSTELAELQKEMDDNVKDLVADYFKKWKDDQAPPTPEQIQTMLSQEYVTFKIKIMTLVPAPVGGEGPDMIEHEREFTIRELPQTIEREFYRTFKKRLMEYGPQLESLQQVTDGLPFEQRVQKFMDMFDGAFDIMAETCAVCLDPFKMKSIGKEWVQNNIGSQRQWQIIQAQMEVNRLRDFFSQLSQAGQKVEMMTKPASFQALQAQLR